VAQCVHDYGDGRAARLNSYFLFSKALIDLLRRLLNKTQLGIDVFRVSHFIYKGLYCLEWDIDPQQIRHPFW
jgi:hypothetical protein